MRKSNHHRVPKSRGGKDSSIQTIPDDFHIAFHVCLRNLLLPEIHEFLDIFYNRDHWTQKQIDEVQERIKYRTTMRNRQGRKR